MTPFDEAHALLTEGDVRPHADRDTLYRQFENGDISFAAYGGMADILAETGWSSLALAFRWMCSRQRMPHCRMNYGSSGGGHVTKGRKVPKAYRWAWYCGDRNGGGKILQSIYPRVEPIPHMLPPDLMHSDQHVFASHQAAVMYLAKALGRLASLVDPAPPKGWL